MADAIFMPNEAPSKEGYLTKRSEWLHSWRRRYFKLVRNQLFFMSAPGEKPHGVIELRHCLTVKSAEDKTGKANSFEIATPDKVFFMFADSDLEKDEWIGKIGKAIVDNSRAHIREGPEVDDGDDDGDE
jgi:hypothetical protein